MIKNSIVFANAISFHVQYNPLEDCSNVWLNAYFWQLSRSRINLTAILTCTSETVIIHTLTIATPTPVYVL